jgi:hypothetical protein
MTPVPTPTPAPSPGSLTVSILFGWEWILALVLLAVVVGVAALIAMASGRARNDRALWLAELDRRSARRWEDEDGPATAQPLSPSRVGSP